MKPKVAVLIPTLNEEATIGRVIDKIPVRVLSDEGYDTVTCVTDGDSEDATQQKARAMTRTNVFGNRALTSVARMLSKEDVTDLCTGFWGTAGASLTVWTLSHRDLRLKQTCLLNVRVTVLA
jgi:hypothetical protein